MKVKLENRNKSRLRNLKYDSIQKMQINVRLRIGKKVPLQNENKLKDCTEKSIKITKIEKQQIKDTKIQLENGNSI